MLWKNISPKLTGFGKQRFISHCHFRPFAGESGLCSTCLHSGIRLIEKPLPLRVKNILEGLALFIDPEEMLFLLLPT